MKAILESIIFRVVLLILLLTALPYGLQQLVPLIPQSGQLTELRSGDLRYQVDDGPLDAAASPETLREDEWIPGNAFRGAARYWMAATLPDPLPPDSIFAVTTNADAVVMYLDGERVYQFGEPGRRQWTRSDNRHQLALPPDDAGKDIVVRLYSNFGQAEVIQAETGSRAQAVSVLLRSGLLMGMTPMLLCLLTAAAAFGHGLRFGRIRERPAALWIGVMAITLMPRIPLQTGIPFRYALGPDQSVLTFAGTLSLDLFVLALLGFIGTALSDAYRRTIRIAMAVIAVLTAGHAATLLYDDAAAALLDMLTDAAILIVWPVGAVLLVLEYRRQRTRAASAAAAGMLVFILLAAKDAAATNGWFVFDAPPAVAELLVMRQAVWGTLGMLAAFGWSLAARRQDAARSYAEELESERRELALLNEAYGRFVPRQLLSRLSTGRIVDVLAGDHRVTKTALLYVDIRDLSAASTGLSADRIVKLLNAYHLQMERIAGEHGGYITLNEGGGVLAVFENGADRAADAGTAIRLELHSLNERLAADRLPAIEVGAAIHLGITIAAALGSEQRMDAAIFGPSVTEVRRIQAATAALGAPLLISEDAFQALSEPDRRAVRAIDRAARENGQAAMELYEVLDAEPSDVMVQKLEAARLLQEGRARMDRREYHQAMRVWEACLRTSPEDPVALYWRERCRRGLRLETVG